MESSLGHGEFQMPGSIYMEMLRVNIGQSEAEKPLWLALDRVQIVFLSIH